MDNIHPQIKSNLNFGYLIAAAGLCSITLLGVVLIILFGTGDNTTHIATVIGISTPLTGTLLALMLNETHKSVNSRLDQLLDSSGEVALAKGIKQGKEEMKGEYEERKEITALAAKRVVDERAKAAATIIETAKATKIKRTK